MQTLPSPDAALAWLAQRSVRALTVDSRGVRPGDAFIAWPGHALDGRQYVPQALAAGARACLVEARGVEAYGFRAEAGVAALADLKAHTGQIASGFMGRPSERLEVVATTGTNGKTSTAWWIAQALTALGRRCGVVGTLGVGEPPRARLAEGEPADAGRHVALAATGLTTPDPVTLHAALRGFVDVGLQACAIEASSIGIVEHRLAGTHIDVALFTNFSQDHLDYHGTLQAYWQAKQALFGWPGLRAAVVNLDDAHGAELAQALAGGPLDLWTTSMRGPARLRAREVRFEPEGLAFELCEGTARAEVRTALIGEYNVSNLLGVIGVLRALGLPLADIALACAGLTPVPGRMQRVTTGTGSAAALPQVVVDYAHSPDALEKALTALQPFAARRGGALWCVFGCGGNRDTAKRPLMGGIAERLAQRVVVTSDNPRHEPPGFIVSQIAAGLSRRDAAELIEDRRAAIAHAIGQADPRDVILVAGKGHEDYQEVAGSRHPFSDVTEALSALQRREQRA